MTRILLCVYLVAMYRRLAALLLVALVLVPAAAAKPSFLIVGDVNVGGFPRTGTVKQAIQVFGQPIPAEPAYDTCTLQWPSYGVTMNSFYTNGALNPCGPSGKNKSVTVTGHGWHTSKGLKMGDPLAKMRKLYPRATKESAGLWQLTNRPFAGLPFPGLEAKLNKKGRVVALTVYGPRTSF